MSKFFQKKKKKEKLNWLRGRGANPFPQRGGGRGNIPPSLTRPVVIPTHRSILDFAVPTHSKFMQHQQKNDKWQKEERRG